MALAIGDVQNALIFMERVQVTGKEALAWAQTFQALHAQLKELQTVPPPAPLAPIEGDTP